MSIIFNILIFNILIFLIFYIIIYNLFIVFDIKFNNNKLGNMYTFIFFICIELLIDDIKFHLF